MPTETININGQDVTSSDDINIVLSLGGTPTGATLEPFSIDVSWSGVLAATRGGTGLNSIGSALQLLRTNAGATGLEYFSATTSDIPEGSNLYYTQGRFDTAFGNKSTSNLAEGTGLYFTESRTRSTTLTGLNITGASVVSTDSILEAFGKVQNQINSLVGGVNYQGTWNATTNIPAIVSGVGTKGYYYVVSVAGSTNIDGITDWKLGDWIIFNGATWQKVDNTDAVISVNGYTGSVVLVKADVGLGNVENTALSTWSGSSNLTTLGTIGTGTWNATTLAIAYGGSGQTTANAALNAFLPTQSAGTINKYLKSDGSNSSWSAIDLTASVTGVLPKANGGTGVNIATTAMTLGTASSSAGSIVFQNATNANTLTMVSGVTSSTYSLTLPTAQGGASTFLQNDGAGVLSWAAAGGGITKGTTTITGGATGRLGYNLAGIYQETISASFTPTDVSPYNVHLGFGAGSSGTYTGTKNSLLGHQAGLSLTSGSECVLIGYQAGKSMTTSAANSTVVIGSIAFDQNTGGGGESVYIGRAAGHNTTTGGTGNTVVGYAALNTASPSNYNTILGHSAGATSAAYSIAIGASSSTGSFNNSVAIGSSATCTAANQFLFSAANSGGQPNNSFYFGGVTQTTANDVPFFVTSGSGTNKTGANFIRNAGAGTGSGAGGYHSWKTSDVLGSGTTLQTLTEKMRLNVGGDLVLGIASDTKGLVLKSSDGHYWRITISTLGVLTTADLGTSIPT